MTSTFIVLLMPEVAHAGEEHRETELVGGLDHFVVAQRAARLRDRSRACFCREHWAVGKWKQRLRHEHGALEWDFQPRRFLARRVHRIDSRSRAAADRQSA